MTTSTTSTPALRRRRRSAAEALAAEQDGIISRRQLYGLGVTRWQVRAQVEARRWSRTGRQTLSTTTGPLTEAALRWVAVLEVGPRAALDGVRPPVAAVHAALWAASDRQAALFLIAPVQQRIVPAAELVEALAVVRRHRRRRFLLAVLADLVDGAQSLGELDFAVGCRRRGLPEPDRQVVRRLPNGRVFLDVEWRAWRVVVEIDGVQHEDPDHRVADALRDNEQLIDGKVVLRIPVLGLRLDETAFLDQVERLLRRRGWAPAAEAV